jgi:hypothetical protein
MITYLQKLCAAIFYVTVAHMRCLLYETVQEQTPGFTQSLASYCSQAISWPCRERSIVKASICLIEFGTVVAVFSVAYFCRCN